MKYVVIVEGETFEIEIDREGRVSVNGTVHQVDLRSVNGGGHYSLLVDGRSYEAYLAEPKAGDSWGVTVEDRAYRVTFQRGQRDGSRHRQHARPAGGEVLAPLPGLLVEVPVSEGQPVVEGQVVAVLESMKMNLELRVPIDGVVEHLYYAVGEEVEQGAVLIRIEPGEG